MVKDKKTNTAAAEKTPRKSSRLSEQVVKRKAIDEASPASTKKRKAVTTDKTAKTEKKPDPKPAKKSTKKAAAAPDNTEDKENDAEQHPDVEVEDDATTMALVEEIDGGDDDGESGDEVVGGAALFKPGQDVGKAPAAGVKKAAQAKSANSKAAEGTVVKAAAGRAANDEETLGGIVYVGRIPHGFFEHEMRSYFSQFGDIRRLRLSRNRKSGASKHYAFIEFADRDVADIVAKTMDNYLLFGHLLRCSVVPPENVPPNLFKGANRRFKAVPWNRMAGRRLAQPKPESDWADKISRETKRRAKRAAQLEEQLGYTFTNPALKSTDAIEAPAETPAIEEKSTEDKAPNPVELAAAVAEAKETAAPPPEAVAAAPAATKSKKGGKKKSKA